MNEQLTRKIERAVKFIQSILLGVNSEINIQSIIFNNNNM